MTHNIHIGSSFDDFLEEDGLLEDCEEAALREILADRIRMAMAEQGLSPSEMAVRMKTSRDALDRLLQPGSQDVSLQVLQKAAAAIGRRLRLDLV